MPDGASAASVIALLGPTNTGKTHRAIERMLDHQSGMLGLPLRLLAREVYDRVAKRIGDQAVALVTGEEKRIPPGARFWICTVEAMPQDTPVEFLAVDEIQLAAHRERGHVFTDRMLRARGSHETWLLGAETIRPLLSQLVPHAQLQQHPRLSELRAVDPSTLGGLPKRSAVVAFSMNRVYELAERLRHRRGGAAVVLGALSPRARNAQVALYQSGEVDYLVATDAIGMGLNLDLSHIAFADLRKFDGRELRGLEPAELAQIAGRAGRHVQNGSFNTLKDSAPLAPRVLRAIEQHQFPPDRVVQWRNPDLDFSSIDDLLVSLRVPPGAEGLRLAEQAEDHGTLADLARRPEIRSLAQTAEQVALLWDVCQIPDFRQLMLSHHANLVTEIFRELMGPRAKLSADFLSKRLARLANYEGDIDTLMRRMAFVRTWTYVTNHGGWAEQAAQFRQKAHEIEDQLSDALHQRLVERFVVQRRRSSGGSGAPEKSHPFWALEQLKDELFGEPGASQARRLVASDRDAIAVAAHGRLSCEGEVVAQLVRGNDLLNPALRLLVADRGREDREAVQQRLQQWLRGQIDELLGPSRPADAGSAHLSGLLYALRTSLGCIERRSASVQLDGLSETDQALLKKRHIVAGTRWVYFAKRLKPRHTALRGALWYAYHAELPVTLPKPGATFTEAGSGASRELLLALSHPRIGPLGVRADIADRLLSLPTDDSALQSAQRLLGVKRKLARQVVDKLRPARRGRRRRSA